MAVNPRPAIVFSAPEVLSPVRGSFFNLQGDLPGLLFARTAVPLAGAPCVSLVLAPEACSKPVPDVPWHTYCSLDGRWPGRVRGRGHLRLSPQGGAALLPGPLERVRAGRLLMKAGRPGPRSTVGPTVSCLLPTPGRGGSLRRGGWCRTPAAEVPASPLTCVGQRSASPRKPSRCSRLPVFSLPESAVGHRRRTPQAPAAASSRKFGRPAPPQANDITRSVRVDIPGLRPFKAASTERTAPCAHSTCAMLRHFAPAPGKGRDKAAGYLVAVAAFRQ